MLGSRTAKNEVGVMESRGGIEMGEEDDAGARYWNEWRVTMALFPGSIKSSGTTRQHSKPFSIKMRSWRLTRHYLDVLKSSSRSEARLLSDLNIVLVRILKEQSIRASPMIRSFSRYCLARPLPKSRRCPNHFAYGSANVWPADHLHRIM